MLDIIRELADERDVSPAQLNLARLLHKEVVDSPIIGPRSIEHLAENVTALDVSLSDHELERLAATKQPVWPRETGGV